jgi:Ni/Co efflux regulator RcnB
MNEILSDIRDKLSNNCFQNEEHVRISLVLRILFKLGWDIWNPKEVNSEFKAVPNEDISRVDIALFSNEYLPPSIFIEIKPVGKIDTDLFRIEQQLRDYNRNNTAQFSIITDGQKWRFYYSQTGGEFSQKCFKVIDIIQNDLSDVINSPTLFLSKDEILSGNSKKEAERLLKLNQKQRALEDALPRAKRMISEYPFPSLPQALVGVALKLGFTITEEEAKEFAQQSTQKNTIKEKFFTKMEIINPQIKNNDYEKKKIISNSIKYNSGDKLSSDATYNLDSLLSMNIISSKPSKIVINTKEYDTKNWTDLCKKFVLFLIENNYLTESNLPIYTYSENKKYFINKEAKHENPERDGKWVKVGNLFIDVKYNANNHVKNILKTLDSLNIQNDIDIKIKLF